MIITKNNNNNKNKDHKYDEIMTKKTELLIKQPN